MKFLGVPSSGSIAGTTSSHNRAGQYTRNRRTPVVGTRTPRQAVVKGNMTIASQSWQGLTASQQAAWTSYAAGHPIVNALGQSIKLTGAQYYIKCNAALLNVNLAQVSTPPSTGVVVPEVVVAFAVSADGLCYLYRTGGTEPDNVALAVSKLSSNGVNFMATFHQIYGGTPSTGFFDLSTAALAWAGTFVTRRKLWLRDTPVSSEGLTGSPVVVQALITATQNYAAPVATSTVAGDATITWAGAPALATVIIQTGPTALGPWSYGTEVALGPSPATGSGLISGQYAQGILIDPATGTFSEPSNAVLIM